MKPKRQLVATNYRLEFTGEMHRTSRGANPYFDNLYEMDEMLVVISQGGRVSVEIQGVVKDFKVLEVILGKFSEVVSKLNGCDARVELRNRSYYGTRWLYNCNCQLSVYSLIKPKKCGSDAYVAQLYQAFSEALSLKLTGPTWVKISHEFAHLISEPNSAEKKWVGENVLFMDHFRPKKSGGFLASLARSR